MNRKTYAFFKMLGKLYFKKPTIYLPKHFDTSSPSIFMCNHEQNYGPVITVTRFPVEFRPWCHSGVVHFEESFAYIRDGFFMQRLRLHKTIAGLGAILIARPLIALVNMNDPIPAYHDIAKCFKTIHMGVDSLLHNENQLIFSNVPILIDGTLNPDFDFMKGYLLVTKKAMKSGVIPKIYPVSINKYKATISIGNPISPRMYTEWNMEKKRIHDYIVREVKLGYDNPQRTLQNMNGYRLEAPDTQIPDMITKIS